MPSRCYRTKPQLVKPTVASPPVPKAPVALKNKEPEPVKDSEAEIITDYDDLTESELR